ncbi:hypothetical protein HELRODRAFT_113267 [Helobdella robusta]|uniref:Bromo domain-containing protein n=1 Tax=Helobdella robusta TaxID=6412 RepID=T1EFR1_HELRO|nr:hypothetical protein HELRODRAFT_113267 [Helobdella robusta]ESO00416.1 hypothetical protein HELRODRAFT_113267 [Helobdella robusta]
MKVIEDLVSELMKNDNAWPFLKPVTVKEAPDYFEIINRPMDLSTIKYKIYRFEYPDQYSIIDDLRLMFDNCNLYNSPNTPVHNAGLSLEQYLDQRLEQIENASINGDMPEGKISRCHAKRNSL